MDELERAVERTVGHFSLFSEGSHVLVALSGGPDSVALLLVLEALKPAYELRISAAHVNHKLRGEESDRDEGFVRRLCTAKGIALRVGVLPPDSRSGGGNLEHRIRRLRYQWLGGEALGQEAVLATGHNLDDQVETFLMKLTRGAGPTGLAGIFPKRELQLGGATRHPVRLVRPLIRHSREEILAYLKRKGQDYREDSSNLDCRFDRNWVRHALLPLLRERCNPRIVDVLGRSADLFRQIAEFLGVEAGIALAQCRTRQENDTLIDMGRLRLYPPLIQKEALRLALEESRGNLKGIAYRHIEGIHALLTKTSGLEIALPGGLRVLREFETLRFTSCPPAEDFEEFLSIPGEIFVKEVGKRIRARLVKTGSDPRGAAFLHISENRLKVRNRRPGDIYETGGGRSRKLKEMLQEARIPRTCRSRLLILEQKGRIVWVEGFEPPPAFRVRGDGHRAVEIRVFPAT